MTTTLEDFSTDLGPQNMEDMDTYIKGASTSGSRKALPGNYTLRMPAKLPDESFVLKPAENGRPAYLQITLDNRLSGDEASGLSIVGGPYDGQMVRYAKVDTLQKTITRYDRATNSSVDVLDAAGNQRFYCDALDLLARFGHPTRPRTMDEWMAAFRSYEGQVIPGQVYVNWEGKEVGRPKDDRGYVVRIKGKAFKRPDGSFSPRIERVAEIAFTQKVKGGGERIVNPGETYTVYADLILGQRPFAV